MLPAASMDGGDPASLVRFAIDRGVDVAVLERLVALQERVTERNARAAFFEAVASFQEECPEVRKSGKAKIATKSGGQYEYNFAPLEEITRTIRPVLRRHGLSYSWDVSDGERSLTVTCVLRHIEGHEERASFPVPTDTDAKMSAAQKNGAALTYGKRQSLTSVLGLTTADADSDAAPKRPQGNDAHEPITDSQLADLETLMAEVGADPEKFVTFLQVESLADLTRGRVPYAIKALEEKRKR